MKKRLVIMIALLLTVSLFGCSRGNNGTGSQGEGNSAIPSQQSETGSDEKQPSFITTVKNGVTYYKVNNPFTPRDSKLNPEKTDRNESGLSQQEQDKIISKIEEFTNNNPPAEDTSSVVEAEYDNTGTTVVGNSDDHTNTSTEPIINEDGDDNELPILP
ncbi:MAG: hypothetical protein IJI05_01760 [Erysipelotrichaceae bacterium]|nr:hypothetical protein [Erysipelotrichaceae bacterium]